MKDKLRKFIVDTIMYGKGSVEDDESLFESGIIDSLGFIKLLAFINEELKVPLDMSDLNIDNFQTINDMVKTIESKTKK